jgi:hypothetical protein
MTAARSLPDDVAGMVELLFEEGDPRRWLELADAELIRFVETALVTYATTGDERMIGLLQVLYPAYARVASLDRRMEWYRSAMTRVVEGGHHPGALLPWLFAEPAVEIASTAALDYAVLLPPEDGNPMTGPKAVASIFTSAAAACPAGLFAGLRLLGDDRVNALIAPLRRMLSEDEVAAVCAARTGFVFAAMVDFLLDWLEETEADEEEGRFGTVAAALVSVVETMAMPDVIDGRRRFPAPRTGSDLLEPGWQRVPLARFAERIRPRLEAIAERETEPRVMPSVLEAWGLR